MRTGKHRNEQTHFVGRLTHRPYPENSSTCLGAVACVICYQMRMYVKIVSTQNNDLNYHPTKKHFPQSRL